MGCGGTKDFGLKTTGDEILADTLDILGNDVLVDRVFLVTGGSTGIGRAVSRILALGKATVIMASRNRERGLQVVQELKDETKHDKIEFMQVDLSSCQSVREFCEAFLQKNCPLHCLINNAGCWPQSYEENESGIEMTFQINHLGHFLLTNLLLDKLKESSPSRIVQTSSMGHKWHDSKLTIEDIPPKSKDFGKTKTYAVSKLCNIMFMKALQRRLNQGTEVTTYSVHPGIYPSTMTSHLPMKEWMPMISSGAMCAGKVLFCAIHPRAEEHPGEYFYNCRARLKSERWVHQNIFNEQFQEDLWDLSVKLAELVIDNAPQDAKSDDELKAVESEVQLEEQEEGGSSTEKIDRDSITNSNSTVDKEKDSIEPSQKEDSDAEGVKLAKTYTSGESEGSRESSGTSAE